MLKKLLIISSIVITAITFGQITNVSSGDIKEVLINAKIIGTGIADTGFKKWFADNWYFFILSIVGLAQVIVKITPSKKDDKILGKILKPMYLLLDVLSLNVKKKK